MGSGAGRSALWKVAPMTQDRPPLASARPSLRLAIATAIAFGLGAPAAVGGGLALAPLTTLAALVAAPWRALPRMVKAERVPLLAGAALAVWMLVSLAWSSAPHAPERMVRTLGTIASGLLLLAAAGAPRDSRAVRIATFATLGLALFLAIEALLGFPLNRLGQPHVEAWLLARNTAKGTAVLALLTFGAATGSGRARTAVFGALTAAVIWFGIAFDMSAALLAALAGMAVWIAGLRAPRFAARAVFATLALIALVAPALAGHVTRLADRFAAHIPFSWADRIRIWDSAAAHIGERPLLGHGFDSSRTFAQPALVDGALRAAIPLHPHNFALQIWLEGGAIGAALAAIALACIGWRVARIGDTSTIQASASLAAAWGVFACLSFGVWQEWWIAALACAATALRLCAGSPNVR